MLTENEILQQLPYYIFWKDKYSNYLGGNVNFLKDAGISSQRELIGKTDYHMPWKSYANKYRSDDDRVLRVEQMLKIEEYHQDVTGKKCIAVVHKKPFYDEGGHLVGIIGSYSKIILKKNLRQPSLPKRQLEVIQLLCEGLSAKQIAFKMKISVRTVEYYIEIIKSKMGCQNKTELIKQAILFGYANFF